MYHHLNSLGEQRGTTSKAVVSSTNLIRALQSFKREFAKTAKRNGSSLVPWDRPPLARFYVEVEEQILTDCLRHEMKWFNKSCYEFTWSFWSSSMTTLWSTKSEPFLKSAKNILMEHCPRFRAERIEWRKYTRAWVVDFVGRANCFASSLWTTSDVRDLRLKPSITFDTWDVKHIGRMVVDPPRWTREVTL